MCVLILGRCPVQEPGPHSLSPCPRPGSQEPSGGRVSTEPVLGPKAVPQLGHQQPETAWDSSGGGTQARFIFSPFKQVPCFCFDGSPRHTQILPTFSSRGIALIVSHPSDVLGVQLHVPRGRACQLPPLSLPRHAYAAGPSPSASAPLPTPARGLCTPVLQSTLLLANQCPPTLPPCLHSFPHYVRASDTFLWLPEGAEWGISTRITGH